MNLSGPLFQAGNCDLYRSTKGKKGGHYNHFEVYTDRAMEFLHQWFPDGQANELNFALFSTSGIHGSYTTIEKVAKKLNDPDGIHEITFVVICPRLCTLYYGNLIVKTPQDIEFLAELRRTSWLAVQEIGKPDIEE